ncbi:MAG: SLC13 family permease [Myxococcota bacterium]
MNEKTEPYKPHLLPLAVVVAVALYFAAGFLPFEGDSYAGQMAAAVTGFVAVCWLTNLVALGAASLMPLALMPMLGVLPIAETSSAYAHPVIWTFFGGFILALGIERWGLHRRLALNIVMRAGANPSRLVLGFAVAAGALSMWLNNTAMCLLLLPIALALVESMERANGVAGKEAENFAFALLVAIAYSCSIGGIGTPIGTAPNAIMLSNYAVYEDAGAPPLTFASWMATAVPVVAILIPVMWFLLVRVLTPVGGENPEARTILQKEARSLPTMSVPEKRIAAIFFAAALMWTFRRDIDLGDLGTIPGWWRLFPVESARFMGDAAVAAIVTAASFLVPAGGEHRGGLMNWATTRQLPWDILFLIGGGIAIAKSFSATGLAVALGVSIQPLLQAMPPIGMVVLVCLAMTFLTEVTSNTAMTALMLPVLGGTAVALEIDPLLLMLPATFSASCAFMLPIATPPNAIVFSSGRVPMLRMAKVGFVINLVGVALISAAIGVLRQF